MNKRVYSGRMPCRTACEHDAHDKKGYRKTKKGWYKHEMKLKITAALLACFLLLSSLASCNLNKKEKDETEGEDIPLLTPGQSTEENEPTDTTTEPVTAGPEVTTTEPEDTTTTPPTTTTTTSATTTEPVEPEDPLTFTVCDETVYVIASALNIRTAPTMDDNIYTQVAMGKALRRVGYNEVWSKIVIEDKEYYVSTKYVSTDDPNAMGEFTARYETVYVTASLLNIRKTPSNVGEIYDTVPKGTEVIRIGYNEGWSKIMYDGDIYYAGSKYLSTEKPDAETTTAATTTAATTTAAPDAQ